MTLHFHGFTAAMAFLVGMNAALAGHERDLSRHPIVGGEIALTDSPFCGFFVVETALGFTLMHWRGEMEIFAEGDRVKGPLHVNGLQRFEHVLEPGVLASVGPTFTLAQVDEWGVGLDHAQKAYRLQCLIGGPRGDAAAH
jgi:hypothetical protein